MIIDFKAHVMPGMDKTCKNRIDTIRRLMAAKDAGSTSSSPHPFTIPTSAASRNFSTAAVSPRISSAAS